MSGTSVVPSFTSTTPFQPAVTIGFDLSPSPVAVEPSLTSGASVGPSFTSTVPFQPAVALGFDLSPSRVASGAVFKVLICWFKNSMTF